MRRRFHEYHSLIRCGGFFSLGVPSSRTCPGETACRGQVPSRSHPGINPRSMLRGIEKGNWVIGKEKYRMGELLCPAAESAVQQVFEKYTRVESVPEKGSASGKVIITPRFVDLENTRTVTAFGKRKMVLLVEWTATDEAGKVFWVQTVEGNAKEKTGNLFTAGGHRRKMLESIKKDLTDKSVQAMRLSPEFQKLAQKAP